MDAMRAVRPGIEILEVSAKTGAGMDAWLQRLARA
jgi:Ni2+-binding GTPase involved in maturation of urease and hydrogenase